MPNLSSLALGFAMALALATNAAAETRTILVDKQDGGEWGYNSVSEYHEQWAGGSFHSLTCCDPGSSGCDWRIRPTIMLIPYAESRIDAGELSGTYSIVHMGTIYNVAWEAADARNCKITERQETTVLN